MAAPIRGVGATASLHHDGPEDADFAVVDLRLFATLPDGERVADPQPVSASVRVERSKLAAVELSVQMSLRLRQAPTGPRLEAWQRIAAELAARGIEAEPADLHAMSFKFVPDDELRAAQQVVWPHGH
ncbi:MAG: hypothetical protein QOE11_2294 [Solirubrobacteraceae bacterium]|nr:hypothetical protein [Solirubrobacteraceae bacterium]